MNRKLFLIIMIITAATMTGCSYNQKNNQLDKNTYTQSKQLHDGNVSKEESNAKSNNTTTDGVKTSSVGDLDKTNRKDSQYNVVENTYKIANITIKYPQITNLGDDDKESKINKLILDSVIDGYDLTETIKTRIIPYYNQPIEDLTMDITYTIGLQDTNILSIKYLGESNISGSMHPYNKLYTTNIDINSVKVLKLSDMFKIDKTLVNAFKNGTYLPWSTNQNLLASDVSTAINQYNDTDLQTALEQSDKPIGDKNPYNIFSYLTKEGLVISIGVAHAMGDHAEIRIPYNGIKDNVNTDNKTLNNLH